MSDNYPLNIVVAERYVSLVTNPVDDAACNQDVVKLPAVLKGDRGNLIAHAGLRLGAQDCSPHGRLPERLLRRAVLIMAKNLAQLVVQRGQYSSYALNRQSVVNDPARVQCCEAKSERH